jgi:hypothetical protein
MILADGPGSMVAGLPAAEPVRSGPARPGSGRRPTPSGVVPPALAALLAPGSSAGDPDLPPGGTLHRALLAYLGEALAVPTGISAYPMDAPSARVATLAYSVAFLAPVDLRHGLRLADSDSTASAAGPAGTYAHTIARFGAPDGTPLARVSHALQVSAVRPYPREFPQRFR